MSWYYFKPYVSVAQRQAKAAREVAKLAKKGQTITPIKLAGQKIASTFWGKAWCDNLESYSDFENRLPRGRSYVRNGSVVDLQITPGQVAALVSGSELYKIKINIKPLSSKCWDGICRQCSGKIGSLIELLQGKLAAGVMEVVTRQQTGLFPTPAEIDMDCSCPDWAGMCKHIAAALYGVGARLDQEPELLFTLRKVNHMDLISEAGNIESLPTGPLAAPTIASDDLQDVFGIELAPPAPAPTGKKSKKPAPAPKAAKSRSKPKKAAKPAKSKKKVARRTARPAAV